MSGMADIIRAHKHEGSEVRDGAPYTYWAKCSCGETFQFGPIFSDSESYEKWVEHVAEELTKSGYGDQHQAWEAGGEAAIERENTYGAEAKAKFSNPYPKGRS
jgi:hypothetical protein